MKKTVETIVSVLFLCTALGSCGRSARATKTETGKSLSGYELALITDSGTIDDKSFNQGSWEGLAKYAADSGKSAKYYQPAEVSDESYLQAIDLAIKGGAKIIVCPGYNFEESVWEAQKKYPDVKFIILDGAPHNSDGSDKTIAKNTASIFYCEQQAGFLAGYAAVREGYTKLGFMGGVAVPAVIKYGYGFVQGADYAAKDLGISSVSCKYTYVGNFQATPENMAKAASWYNEGTECIFACGGAVGNSVMKAAETSKVQGKKVIGVDVDQAGESPTVITSAMKNLGQSVIDTVASSYSGTFPGGVSRTLTAKEIGIQLPMASSRFTRFTQADYADLFKKLADGTITVKDNTAASSADRLGTGKVKVEVIN